MISAVESKLEKVRAIEDVRDRVYELEQLQHMGSGFENYRGEMPDGRAELDEMKDRAEALEKYIEDSILEGKA